MKAIVVQNPGPASTLELKELPDPLCKPGEALIHVRATSVNRADLLQRAGKYAPPPCASEILGLDVAGEIVKVADAKSRWRAGDRVCALVSGGGYASMAAVPEKLLMPIPKSWSFEQGAAMPEVFITAYLNLIIEGALRFGERILVHGGSSGVGTAAIQIAKSFGAEVLVTVGSKEKASRCVALGASHAIEYKSEDFVEKIRTITAGEGVDLILDCIGGEYVARNVTLLKARGRLVIISMIGGTQASLDLRPLLSRRLTIRGSVLRSRSLDEKIELTEHIMRELLPLFEAGKIAPVIDSVFSLAEAEKAHRRMESSEHIGKIVISKMGD